MITDKTIAYVLAKAHLQTELTDFVVVGFNRKNPQKPVEIIYECANIQTLALLLDEFQKQADKKIDNDEQHNNA